MANFVVVEVAKRVESLAHDLGSLGLGEVLAVGDVEKQFTAFAES